MSTLTTTAIHWAERGMLPDTLIRAGFRALLRERLTELPLGRPGDIRAMKESFVAQIALRNGDQPLTSSHFICYEARISSRILRSPISAQ